MFLFLTINSLHFNKVYAEPCQIAFQPANSPMLEGIVNLHNDIFAWLLGIIIFVLWMIIRTVFFFEKNSSNFSSEINHQQALAIEIIWTIVPSLILLNIAIPSFGLLYSLDEIIDPLMTLKVIGHQWYWSYEYPDLQLERDEKMFDSYMVREEDLLKGELRLLEVDNRVVIPAKTHIRVLITSTDVLHSWALPSLGIKMDACPGRLNQLLLFTALPKIHYGQCSEICGVNHAFMPIVVESVPMVDFLQWISK